MWVKGSGRPLAQCDSANAFVPLNLACVLSKLSAATSAEPDFDPCKQEAGPLRPSIETSLHALMPQRLVAHLHPVNALSWLVRRDARQDLARLLQGLDWAWVDYVRPGVPLTRAVQKLSSTRKGSMPAVLMLANHGVVIAAESAGEIFDRLSELEDRLRVPCRKAAAPAGPALEKLARHTGCKLPCEPVVHSLATDAASFASASAGCLYPDHIVFLGPAATVVREDLAIPSGIDYAIVKGTGVILSPSLSASAEQMLKCQAEVLLRIPAGTALRYLTEAEVAEIAGWEAEKYRKQRA